MIQIHRSFIQPICGSCSLSDLLFIMSSPKLREVLELCQEVTAQNKTDSLFGEMEYLLKKNFELIQKETTTKRSEKRRMYGQIEAQLIDYFMKMCNYSCSKTNIYLVHKIMTELGYGGYDNETRFRQRTENTLKKKKHSKEGPFNVKKKGKSKLLQESKLLYPSCYKEPFVCFSSQEFSQENNQDGNECCSTNDIHCQNDNDEIWDSSTYENMEISSHMQTTCHHEEDHFMNSIDQPYSLGCSTNTVDFQEYDVHNAGNDEYFSSYLNWIF